ncbi:hypothetical protein ACETRX_04150 [Labrys portucalensis]|uniref:Uncharacterized protein n=1 Tax=Labrys neptuniae TaxID=376174 RepID=A0ABV6Z9C7_9HYPH
MNMLHYHGTPITPIGALYQLSGRCFCVSHARPDDVARVHQIGQSVMLDNGAFSKWKAGRETNWPAFYDWCDRWLDYPTTWAVIPDVIDGGSQLQDALVKEWPFGQKGAPVWHMDEPIGRLLKLTEEWPRVCIGSTAEYAVVLSPAWRRRMDEVWNALSTIHRRTPNIHMLRGMQLSGRHYPFASVDSTDVAQNHNRPQNTPRSMADRWDAMQSPGRWVAPAEQLEIAI